MALPDELKIEVDCRLDQQATDDLGQHMWRGIYTIRFRDELVAKGRTMASFYREGTAKMAAQSEAEKLFKAMSAS